MVKNKDKPLLRPEETKKALVLSELELLRPAGLEERHKPTFTDYFIASLDAEKNKLGKHKKELRQLTLGEYIPDLDIEDASVHGLNFTNEEDRAYQAVQKLLHRGGYESRILETTYSELYEAYGLKPAGDGRYHGEQVRRALLAFKSLTDKRVLIAREKDDKGRYKAIRVYTAVINFFGEGFENLSDEEMEILENGGELESRRQTKVKIEVSSLLVNGIDRWHVHIPDTLHEEIKELKGSTRYSRTISLFSEYLLTLDKSPITISRATLIARLRLDGYERQRKQNTIDKRINEALEYAMRLGFLLDYEKEPTGLVRLWLNPETCKRYAMRLQTEEDKDEKDSSITE